MSTKVKSLKAGVALGAVTAALRGIKLAQDAAIDFAILDLNLNGERTYPIAEALRARGVPFIFATGYGSGGVDEAWKSVRVLPKPFEPHQVAAAIAEVRA